MRRKGDKAQSIEERRQSPKALSPGKETEFNFKLGPKNKYVSKYKGRGRLFYYQRNEV